MVDIAWQNFKRHDREALDQPVTYEAVYYRDNSETIMTRLQSEFPLALRALADKTPIKSTTHIIPFRRSNNKR